MKIKIKILAGFFVIIVMLMVAGAMSVFQFRNLSKSINAVVSDNYKSIEASKNMIESLEREDSGLLLFISGEKEMGKEILISADSVFTNSLLICKNNITENGEPDIINNIDKFYEHFKQKWNLAFNTDSLDKSTQKYYQVYHKSFLELKNEVNILLDINEKSMYEKASNLKDKANRAHMPGMMAIFTSLAFLILFNFLISRYYVNPLKNIITSLKNFTPGQKKEFSAGIDSKDELKELEEEVNNLINKICK